MNCPRCKMWTVITEVKHDKGCGFYNEERLETPHIHCFCERCNKDWIKK